MPLLRDAEISRRSLNCCFTFSLFLVDEHNAEGVLREDPGRGDFPGFPQKKTICFLPGIRDSRLLG